MARKILSIVGARPQFIKASVLSRLFRSQNVLEEKLIHTGQHYDESLSERFFTEMEIPAPSFNLGIGSGSHGAQTGRMLEKIEEVFLHEKPDLCLVYGDTNSTLAGALAAAKLQIPVAHVEAGLRSFNRSMPEETNRVLTDHVSDLLFCPTDVAMENLKNEGLGKRQAHLVGDIMLDASLYYSCKNKSEILKTLALAPKSYALATLHRAENTDNPARLGALIEGLGAVSKNLPVVIPLHPRTRKILASLKIPNTLRLIEPLGYFDMMEITKNAQVVATDSGGLQKEAYFFRVPCVTLRSETEWTELVTAGWNRLADPSLGAQHIRESIFGAVNQQGQDLSLYGDGACGEKILQTLTKFLSP